MLKEERQKQVIEILHTKGRVEVEDLCRMFNVTNMTIRRDMDELEKQGLLIRSHGGALLPDSSILAENPFHFRLLSNKERKLDIAATAVSYLADGQKVFIGSGTTTTYMAQRMDNSKRLIVVTDAINIAAELINRSSISVIQVGGDLRPTTQSVAGAFSENMIKQLRFKSAFIGVTGIGNDGQLYAGSVAQLNIYQAIIESASNVIVLADSTKLGTEDFVSVGRLSNKFILITNKDITQPFIDLCGRLGTTLVTV